MAKVKGPLMSIHASGKFGKTLVFSTHPSGNVVRKLSRSANPQSINQQQARNFLRVANECVHWAATTDQLYPGYAQLVRDQLADVNATKEGWNHTYVSAIIGKQGANYAAAEAIQDSWGDTEHEAWEAAADSMNPPLRPVRQVAQGGAQDLPIDSGRVFLHAIYGLAVLGLVPMPGDEPPIFTG
jgi:hypothetical protein